ncbi:MAG: hypothetical protein IIZ92_04400 [Aquincola sp.]|nr:hypothetical protein [Aquincola sp.]
MTLTPLRAAAALAVCGALLPLAAQADSAVSSASSAGSASSGSVSDSLRGSSRSSNRDDKVADGNYRVIDVATAPDRPGMLRLTLQAEGAEFQLDLPQRTGERSRLQAGDTVQARHRAYGIEFARADNREPFFLVLADDWHRELASRPVAL